MSIQLVLGIAGLALVDSVNPATLLAVTLLLLLPVPRPVATALCFVAGAYTAVFLTGVVVYLTASALATDTTGLTWIRRGAFTLAAISTGISAARRLRPRMRKAVILPGWLTPWTAAPLGVAVTALDLPNAFPYFIAIERLLAAQVPTGAAIAVLASYALIYCIPCLVLLAVGVLLEVKVRPRLQPLYDRYGSAGEQPASPRAVALLGVLAVAFASLAAFT